MRILIADSDPAVRSALVTEVGSLGHEPVACTNGIEALATLLDAEGPPLAILGSSMPGLDGQDVCRRLRAAASTRHVLLLTRPGVTGDIVGALSAGADDHLSTPVVPGELCARIRTAVCILTLRDRAARQQDQLEQAQRLEAIGQLAAGIAHDVNTPTQYVGDNLRFFQDTWPGVTAVLECAAQLAAAHAVHKSLDVLADRLATAVAAADLAYLLAEIPVAVAQSLDGVGRIGEIVRVVQEFSRAGPPGKTAFDVNRAIETAVSVSRHEWKYVCDVVTDLDATLPLVPCLSGAFNQVMLTLIVNAAHAVADVVGGGAEKGRVGIETRHVGGSVEIHVSDTGAGIPEGIRGRVFEPFFTTRESGGGTGQGLAIAHDIVVKKHGGRIWFDTDRGRGTTFHVSLPLEGPAVDHAHEEALSRS